MAKSGAERQAALVERRRKALAEALAQIEATAKVVEALQVRVAVLERENDRLADQVGLALWQEKRGITAEAEISGPAVSNAASRPATSPPVRFRLPRRADTHCLDGDIARYPRPSFLLDL